MHAAELSYRIVDSHEARPGLGNPLIRELAAIDSEHSIQGAAKALGLSYRFLWGEIERWEAAFGQKLVLRERGRPARLTALGEKLLWAERSVLARHAVEIAKIRAELGAAFALAEDPDAQIVTLSGCFDAWLARLPRFALEQHIILELRFSTSREGLAALREGRSDLAAFNFPQGSKPGSPARAMFAPLLRSGVGVCRFSMRSQGLAVAPGNPRGIRSLSDIARSGLVYAGRQAGTGTDVLLRELLLREGLPPDALGDSGLVEPSHRSVATAVASGRADAGLCVAEAARASGAGFVPLARESYCLAWRKDRETPPLRRLLGLLTTPLWRESAREIFGIDGSRCGEALDPERLFEAE